MVETARPLIAAVIYQAQHSAVLPLVLTSARETTASRADRRLPRAIARPPVATPDGRRVDMDYPGRRDTSCLLIAFLRHRCDC